MNAINYKHLIIGFTLTIFSATANAALIRYNFVEESVPQVPSGELFSGYYIFESTTANTSSTIDSGEFIDSIVEIGISFSGQDVVFNNCPIAPCSVIRTVDSAEEHYNFNAELLDSTGTRTLTMSLRSGDMFNVNYNPNVPDFLQFFPNQSFTSDPNSASNITFEFQGTDGATYSDIGLVYTVSMVPVPPALVLMLSGLALLITRGIRRNS